MESILFILLPISLLLLLGLGILAFFEVAFAGPGRAAPALLAQPDLPLLSGDALRQWASGKARQVVAKYSQHPRKATTAIALAHEIEDLTSRIIDSSQPRRSLSRLGRCDTTSRGTISLTTPETVAIVDVLRHRLPRRQLKEIHDRAAKNAERLAVKEQPSASDVATVCPLLSPEGCCVSYESRPVYCRGHCLNCTGIEWGPAAATEPRDAAFAASVGQGISEGLAEGLTAAGLDGQRYELNSALMRALDVPDASARWARGEVVLKS
jgi:Fe-S-cluster containining protein